MGWRHLNAAVAAIAILCPLGAESAEHAELTLDIAGRITPRCSIAFGVERVSLGRLDRAGAVSAPLTIACNDRARIALRSRHGGFTRDGGEDLITYRARLVAAGGEASEAFTSAALRAGVRADWGAAATESSDAALRIDWSAPERVLTHGRYADIVTITLELEGGP